MTEVARMRKELLEFPRDCAGLTLEPVGDSLTKLRASLKGPVGTPYEGGTFVVDVDIPRDYPFAPPKMKFVTRVWHPNVSSQTGAICLSTLKDDWSPALTIKTALLSLQALLSAPEPGDPQDAEVAGQYKRNIKDWEATARYWTETYAMPEKSAGGGGGGGGGTAMTPQVQQLVAMGFGADAAARALRAKGGSVEQALELLFSSAQ